MPQALVRLPDDSYVEYFFDSTHGVYGNLWYPSTENLLSYGTDDSVIGDDYMPRGGYAPEEIHPLCANFARWVLAVGLDYDIVFIGHNAEGNVLIHGDFDSFRVSKDSRFLDIAQIVQGAFFTDDRRGFREYGQIINSPSWLNIAPFFTSQGILPALPPNTPLDPIQTSDGWDYWRLIWS